MPKKFFVRLEARPSPKMVFDPPDLIAGFFQTLGVTAEDEDQLLRFVHQHLEEKELGAELVAVDDFTVPDFDGADQDLAEYEEASQKIGVWYVSGRAFYPHEDDGEDEN